MLNKRAINVIIGSRSKLRILRYTYVCKLARPTGQLCKLGHAHMAWMRRPAGLGPRPPIVTRLLIYLLTSGLCTYLPTSGLVTSGLNYLFTYFLFTYLFTYFRFTYFRLNIYSFIYLFILI